jgi:transcriptional regulator with XRE-family HTH domain
MALLDYVANQLRLFRTEYNSGEGISQEALARELDVAPNTISRWETGIYQPGLADLENLARFFGVSIISFFPHDTEDPENDDLMSLMRAAKQLDPDDLLELRKYAEFRKARRIYKGKSRPRAGRKGRKTK